MLTMVHFNQARLERGVFHVDRKFHTGMQEYLSRFDVPIVTVHPELPPARDSSVMDLVAIPEKELGYGVVTLRHSESNRLFPEEVARLRKLIAESRLVYGTGFGAHTLSAAAGVPYVAVLEYNLRTSVVFATTGVDGRLSKAWRATKSVRYHLTDVVPAMRRATSVHCNGYPIYEEAGWFNRERVLYLDSRMKSSMLIGEGQLKERLAARRQRTPRLIFSGRLEPAKGALDVVKIAVALRNVPCEFIIYGQGSQRAEMEAIVRENGLAEKVKINDAIPYPQLVVAASDCDVFVCCHVQADPSCTYLESMGCGLPIVGYGNAMWRAMQAASGAGVVTKLGSPALAADALRVLLANPVALDELSWKARSFAAGHTFEKEFQRRTDSLNTILARRPTSAGGPGEVADADAGKRPAGDRMASPGLPLTRWSEGAAPRSSTSSVFPRRAIANG
jgi:colanic acid/amylovoran biosynthesis glycosyltransferase